MPTEVVLYSPQDFFVRSPSIYSASISDEEVARNLFKEGMVRIDCSCKICTRESVFHNLASALVRNVDVHFHHLHGSHIIAFVCQRCRIHQMSFAISLSSDAGFMSMGVKPFKSGIISKFGQSISHADIHRHELKSYQKILSNADFSEISRARGLASVGVNVGAFVYLRRVFERLINGIHESSEGVETRANFSSLPMDAKILSLKSFLPDFLIDNKRIYGILSKGIHELSEEDCGRYYMVIHESILLMLDEALANKERKRKMQALSAAISSIDPTTRKD